MKCRIWRWRYSLSGLLLSTHSRFTFTTLLALRSPTSRALSGLTATLAGDGDHGDGPAVFVPAEGDNHGIFAVADVLAVQREAAGEQAAVFLKPGGEGGGLVVWIDEGEKVVERVVAGHFEPSALFFPNFEAAGVGPSWATLRQMLFMSRPAPRKCSSSSI